MGELRSPRVVGSTGFWYFLFQLPMVKLAAWVCLPSNRAEKQYIGAGGEDLDAPTFPQTEIDDQRSSAGFRIFPRSGFPFDSHLPICLHHPLEIPGNPTEVYIRVEAGFISPMA